MAETKRDKLRRPSATPSNITDLMQRMAAGVSEETALAESRGYHYAANGLDIQRELTDDDWRNILPEIKALRSSYQLIIGDWMLYGFEHGYVVSYEDMAILTGMQPQTIEVYTSICRNVPRLIRINPLKFSHYRLIAPLPEDDRIVWIEFAAGHALSFRALQKLIDFAYLPRLPESTSPADNGEPPPPDSPTIEEEEEEEATDLILPPTSLDDAENLQSLNTLQKILKTGSYRNATYQEAVIIHRRIAVARRALSLLEAELPRLKRGK